MARSLRIEFAGALYHITSRGNARENIYLNKEDRINFLELLAEVCVRHHWLCHAYCLMDNHYHLLIETQCASLSKGMKMLNGNYTQMYNKQHRRVGHVFQGRFKGVLVQEDAYLLELSRYIVLNPVRARMVHDASQWPWSSYCATAGLTGTVEALTIDWVLLNFHKNRAKAQQKYIDFIKDGKNQPSPWDNLKNQIYLGSDEFVNTQLKNISTEQSLLNIPVYQKNPIHPVEYFIDQYADKKESMARAYLSGHFTLESIAKSFNVGASTVGRAVKKYELRK